MAVTVEQAPFVVLDEDYRIVEVGSAAEAGFGSLLGRNVFECFPGSQPLYEPYYERARRCGETVEFTQYYGGYVTRVSATPQGSRLAVFWDTLVILDVMTLDGLRDSLQAALQTLTAAEETLQRESVRRLLRIVEGAG